MLGVTELQCFPAPFQQTLKLSGINLIGTNKQAVPRVFGDQRLLGTNTGQPVPKMRHMATQGGLRARGRLPVPQRIGNSGRR